jgi:lysophospholipase L1-like esterase
MTDEVLAQAAHAVLRLLSRDVVLLPLISLGTIALLFGLAEAGSRLAWPAHAEDPCLAGDESAGFTWRPRCVAHVKSPESAPVSYRINECGYRSLQACGEKPLGTSRIVAVGNSDIFGYWIETGSAFPELVAADLARACAHPVDSQNLGVPGTNLYEMARRVDEAIALGPDVVLLSITATDLTHTLPADQVAAPHAAERAPHQALFARAKNLFRDATRDSRFVQVFRHYLYSNRETYIQAMILRGDAETMHEPLGPVWEQRLKITDEVVAAMAAKLRHARIPLVLVFLPSLAQLEVIKAQTNHPELDPYLFQSRLGEIAQRHGVAFVASMRYFAEMPDPAIYYLVADGHLNDAGHRRLADAVLQESSRKHLAAFAQCEHTPATAALEGTPR